ncbi:hypothetical protein B0H19DRAFT_969339 [Mycena capillaripes]|nr:hypothetical protein B0H19DRAFT_969339 [Mycena capillaripes]
MPTTITSGTYLFSQLSSETHRYLSYFPRVVNSGVKTGFKELTELPDYYSNTTLDDNRELVPSGMPLLCIACPLVAAHRASGHPHADVETTITEGNTAGGFGDPAKPLQVVALLKNVDTLVGYIFVVDRLFEQYLVFLFIYFLPARPHPLGDMYIRRFLQVLHLVQDIISAEKMPTLSYALLLYEQLIIMLKDLAKELPKLILGINAIIRKLEEYFHMSRQKKIYGLTMRNLFFRC